eukprot:SAG22_NODE_794_length_7157_cov_3.169453_4_plen_102_part_00
MSKFTVVRHCLCLVFPLELRWLRPCLSLPLSVWSRLGFVNVTANPGDVIIMPLRLNHAVLPWVPTDRDRIGTSVVQLSGTRPTWDNHALVQPAAMLLSLAS